MCLFCVCFLNGLMLFRLCFDLDAGLLISGLFAFFLSSLRIPDVTSFPLSCVAVSELWYTQEMACRRRR